MEEKTDIKPAEINLNALSSPEGTAPDNFDTFVSKEAEVSKSTSTLFGLPNLDPTTENTNENPEIPAVAEIIPDAAAVTEKPTVENPWFQKPFKALQKRLGLTDEEFKIPEGLTEENYDEKYNELLWEHTEREGEESKLHPKLKKINELINKGVSYDEALGAYQKMDSLEKLSDKELVSLSLKQQFGKSEERKEGWDDDKINERVAKMDSSGYLEIEAERLRTQIKSEKENINARYEENIKQESAKRNEQFEKSRTEQINESLEYLSGMKEVYGIPISKAELNEFKDDFTYLVTPNKEGVAPLTQLLQSNEELVKIAYFLRKGDVKLRSALTKAKEDAKKSVIDRLDDEPRLPKKTSPYMNEAAIDLDKMSAPART
jgi:hypothetical protein